MTRVDVLPLYSGSCPLSGHLNPLQMMSSSFSTAMLGMAYWSKTLLYRVLGGGGGGGIHVLAQASSLPYSLIPYLPYYFICTYLYSFFYFSIPIIIPPHVLVALGLAATG